MINAAALQELITLCNQRIYLFVDDAADRIRELRALARSIGPEGKKLTVVMAERINEWNISCASLSALLSNSGLSISCGSIALRMITGTEENLRISFSR